MKQRTVPPLAPVCGQCFGVIGDGEEFFVVRLHGAPEPVHTSCRRLLEQSLGKKLEDVPARPEGQ
jgi:hypothetical protein